ncbi:RagB/SusD family nutrient uptake outer membrane protein [Chitinophaga sp.]|uniref:RagB/SusD family nutrient uptake outer membrane protein n=1 Tax=Chitinophaga sp. TaxID=1869181 RepID=UPI002CF927DF|nr:RagB/SusD family nutrient uptake outer membrane protein [Chitinophaga sp.]HWV64702.1 RagB/SusD family nutrient uptake outer membrane protein [Chitinophaga sp.]
MKKRLGFLSLIVLCLATACKKSFIELAPPSTAGVDNLYQTDEDFKQAELGIYDTYQTQYKDMWLYGDMRGDDSWDELVKSTPAAMDLFTINNDNPVIKSTWLNYYEIVSRTNLLLSRIELVDKNTVPNKDVYVAEAKFLRALAYFDLVRIYGDVPLVTRPITIDEAYKTGREKVATIYSEVIVKDLQAAAAGLPAKFAGADVGRATQGAAKALLGKVYLTLKDFPSAETVLKEVTTMGYALLPNYKDLFDYTKDEHHSEYIFDIEYEQGLSDEGSPFTTNFCPKNPDLSSFYGVTGGQNGANNAPRSLFAIFPAGDLRKDITAADGFVDNNGVYHHLVPTSNDVQTFTAKYMTPLIATNDSRANWKVIRYADVLLMLAEALNENGKPGEALPYLNKVHKRAGLADYGAMAQAAMRDTIYLERRLELSFEGQRWFDLVRTGRALETMASHGMKDYMTIFPIPLSQIQLINDPAIFPQNPGYD